MFLPLKRNSKSDEKILMHNIHRLFCLLSFCMEADEKSHVRNVAYNRTIVTRVLQQSQQVTVTAPASSLPTSGGMQTVHVMVKQGPWLDPAQHWRLAARPWPLPRPRPRLWPLLPSAARCSKRSVALACLAVLAGAFLQCRQAGKSRRHPCT